MLWRATGEFFFLRADDLIVSSVQNPSFIRGQLFQDVWEEGQNSGLFSRGVGQ